MNPLLAALSCLLALSPAYAQAPAGDFCANPDQFGGRDRAWIVAFDDIDARFKALPEERKEKLQKTQAKASGANAGCAALSGVESAECGVFADHLLIRNLFKIGKRWYEGDRESPSLELSDAAWTILDRVCDQRQQREAARKAAVQEASDEKAALILKKQREEQYAAAKRMAQTLGSGLPAPEPGPVQSPTLYQTAANAWKNVKQTVSELTPDIISANVGRRCGNNPDPDCGCRVWREMGCSLHPESPPACRSTAASMCPSLGQ
jgi:hypothetical protein